MRVSEIREAIDHMVAVSGLNDPDLAVVAEHDQLWIGPQEFEGHTDVTNERKSRMEELGFHWDYEYQTWYVLT